MQERPDNVRLGVVGKILYKMLLADSPSSTLKWQRIHTCSNRQVTCMSMGKGLLSLRQHAQYKSKTEA